MESSETDIAVPPSQAVGTLRVKYALVFLSICISVILFFYTVIANRPPTHFPLNEKVVIPDGATVSEIGTVLARQNVIMSATLFYVFVIVEGVSTDLQAGTYSFPHPLSLREVVRALTVGTYADAVKITIPEGSRISDIDTLLTNIFSYPRGSFADIARGQEGYLFPETYHVARTATAEDIFELLQRTYREKIDAQKDFISSSGRTEEEIVTMASILEREGKSPESMRLIAGILWKRLEIGMPLQVDATLEYVVGRGSAELTHDDLNLDSPYNTYTYKGLPPTPISNPGMIAITSALLPTPSPYLYYLTDTQDNFHYAKTFEEHKRNKEQYLKNE